METSLLNGDDIKRGNSLKWWHENCTRFPRTARLARRVLAAQATESDVERNYSHAGYVLSQLRSSLSPEMFHKIVFIYENRRLISAADANAIFA